MLVIAMNLVYIVHLAVPLYPKRLNSFIYHSRHFSVAIYLSCAHYIYNLQILHVLCLTLLLLPNIFVSIHISSNHQIQ